MEYVKLGSVARVVSGHPFKSSDMSNTGIPIIKIKNIQPPLVNVSDTDRVCTMAIDKRAERFMLCKGDVLIAMTGATVGKIGRVPELKEPTYLNQRVGKLFLTDHTRADYDYLYYVLSRDVTIQEIFSLADGSAQANVSGSQIENLLIPLPSLETQKEIAHILCTLDDKIELNHRMNQTLEEMAQTLYKHWFIDFEFPNEEGKPYKSSGGEMVESVLGLIPKGWKVGRMGDIIEILDYKRIPLNSKSRSEKTGIYPYYGATGILDHVNGYIFDGTYLLVGEDGTVQTEEGKPNTQYVKGKFWVSNHAHVLQGSSYISEEFLELVFNQTDIGPYITGAVQPKLSKNNLASIPCIIPKEETVGMFTTIIFALYNLMSCNNQTNSYLLNIHQITTEHLLNKEKGNA